MSTSSQYLVPFKFLLLFLQFILVVFIATSRQEYIFQGLPSTAKLDSVEYQDAEKSLLAASLIFIIIIFLEFFTILFGLSVLFDRINAFQILFHFIGVTTTIWFVLDPFQYKTLWSIMGFFGAIPFLLEIIVVFAACSKFQVVNRLESKQRQIEKETNLRLQEKIKAQQGTLSKEKSKQANGQANNAVPDQGVNKQNALVSGNIIPPSQNQPVSNQPENNQPENNQPLNSQSLNNQPSIGVSALSSR